MSSSKSNRYQRFINWRKAHLTDSGLLLFLAFAIGLLTGVAAWLLKFMIQTVTRIVARGVESSSLDWIVILVPVVGVVLTALYCKYILRDKVDNGVQRMVSDLGRHDYNLSVKTIYGSLISSALTLGFGGTAGSEGPIAYAGAGIGSKVGRLLKMEGRMLMVMLGCGAAAGIAGIFKAPIGGALFAIEVLRIELSTVAVMGVFFATVTAALVAYVLSGCTLDIDVISPGAFDNSTMLWTVVLGVVCGIYSLYYTHTGAVTRRLLTGMKRPWIAWITSGLMIGVMIYLFPSMYGEGYQAITGVINGSDCDIASDGIMKYIDSTPWAVAIACGGILALKGIGSSATNNGGGVSGDFAPTLYAGCMLGLCFASVLSLLGVTTVSAGHYALIGMAGAMAGIIRAPFMAMFLTTEMVGGVEFMLPAAIVSIISYCIVMIIKRDTFYHSKPFAGS
ncbi:MAG: chloride channel protein [Clostridiales bacterium]|nr:chloride channel protein [Clostridiales bacterium]